MIGTLAGLAAAAVGLALLSLSLLMLAGGWGLLGSSAAWLGAAVLLVKPEVLYARTT